MRDTDLSETLFEYVDLVITSWSRLTEENSGLSIIKRVRRREIQEPKKSVFIYFVTSATITNVVIITSVIWYFHRDTLINRSAVLWANLLF